MGILGTDAPLFSDLNLIMFLVLTVVFVGSVVFARRKQVRVHGRVMGLLVAATLVSLGLIMGPSLVIHGGVLVAAPLALGNLITEVHVIVGALAIVGSLRLVYRMARRQPCGTRREMVLVAGLWGMALFFGFGFYRFFFLPL